MFFATKKPDLVLSKTFDGETIRTLMEEEVLELLEGPKKVEVKDVQRGRLKATKDDKTGWITLKDQSDVVYAAPNTKLYTCVTSVAMTDGEDIKACKVIRKLEVGEQFEATGPPSDDAGTGIERLPG